MQVDTDLVQPARPNAHENDLSKIKVEAATAASSSSARLRSAVAATCRGHTGPGTSGHWASAGEIPATNHPSASEVATDGDTVYLAGEPGAKPFIAAGPAEDPARVTRF